MNRYKLVNFIAFNRQLIFSKNFDIGIPFLPRRRKKKVNRTKVCSVEIWTEETLTLL